MARFTAFDNGSDVDGSASDSSSRSSSPPFQPTRANGKPARRRPYVSSSNSSSVSARSAEDSSDETEDDIDSIMDTNGEVQSIHEEGDQDEPVPWAKQLDLEPQRVHVMQASLFREPELSQLQKKERTSFLKHQRSMDVHFDQKDASTRTSFAQPTSQAPPRKYVRVAPEASVSANRENLYADAGLSMGRSFRVGWGPGNKLVHVGDLNSSASSSQGANTSIVNVTTLQLDSPEEPDLLQHLLSHSDIFPPSPESENTPYANPKANVAFSSFSSLFTAQDKSHCASVFRLGHALFDPLNLHLRDDVPAEIRNRILVLRRTEALYAWLARAVSSSVEQDIKAAASNDAAKVAFLHLTGNQVEKAVEVLTSSGNVRLATIISQIPGDVEFRADIRDQLQIWKDEKVDSLMSESVRKLYALAAGEVDILEGSSRRENVDVAKGLDWLRVFGLQLWFATSLDTPLGEAFEVYEQVMQESNGRVGFPKPWYSKSPSLVTSVKDGLFSLIKLSFSPSMTLESTLNALSFSPNPRDFKMPWLLYILLSRCLRMRDFTDRQLYDAMEEDSSNASQEAEGYSQVANMLTTNFASQLQQEGLIQEAAYVLLFLEDDLGRKRAIKELLSQSAPLLDEFKVAGLCGSLRIPSEWVDEAKATHALYCGDIYLAYELYTRAKVHRSAHELAITYLAPEAILRNETNILSKLFTALDASLIDNFGDRGQLFIDYAHIVSRVPELREILDVEGHELREAAVSELEGLGSRIPALVKVLPDVLHDKPGTGDQCSAALSYMLSNLLDCVDSNVPTKVEVEPGLVDEGARIKHIHASAYGSFMRTIAELA